MVINAGTKKEVFLNILPTCYLLIKENLVSTYSARNIQ